MPSAVPSSTILNIDDDPAKRYSISRILQNAGFNVIEADTGSQGLGLISEHPDLAIVDIHLPDMDGFELCRKIKEDQDQNPVMVVHLSAEFVDSVHRARGLDAGADAYLTYPVEPHELIATVKALLRLRAAESQARTLAQSWQSTFDAFADGVALLDSEGAIVKVNAAFAMLMGSTSDEIIGQKLDAALKQNMVELRETLGSLEIAPDGTRSTAEIMALDSYYRITLDPMQSGGAVCTMVDITVQRQLEHDLAETYKREHRIAETLQRSFLLKPTFRFDNLDVQTYYEPASDEVNIGGDMFDYFGLTDGRIALAVTDVAGKGLAAAARTAEIKFALRAYLTEHLAGPKALDLLNRFLLEQPKLTDRNLPDTSMVVIAVALINFDNDEVEFCCAGAEPPIIFSRDASGDLTSEVVLPTGNIQLGAFIDARYNSSIHSYRPGDVILMATDGITEARSATGGFLGHEVMRQVAERALQAPEAALQGVGEKILKEAHSFTGERLRDDICMLLARRID